MVHGNSATQTSPFTPHSTQWRRILFVQDPSTLRTAIHVTVIPNVRRSTNPLLLLLTALYSKLLNVVQVFCHCFLLYSYSLSQTNSDLFRKEIYAWNKTSKSNLCWKFQFRRRVKYCVHIFTAIHFSLRCSVQEIFSFKPEIRCANGGFDKANERHTLSFDTREVFW